MKLWKTIIVLIIKHIYTELTNNSSAVYDYCSLEDTYLAKNIINHIKSHYEKHFDQNNENCVFLNQKYLSYETRFSDLYLKSGHLNIRCPKCTKIFRNKELLLIHYKLFHSDTTFNELSVCPADLCLFLDCKRYSSYFEKVKVSAQERELSCDKELESFYKRGCMNLFKSCLRKSTESTEKNIEITYDFYKNFCSKIDCELYKDDQNQLYKPSSFLEVMRLLAMYMFGVFTLIYLLIIWVSHYQ
jgi:hypothetical protein